MPNRRHVALGTISFTVCFAAWGLIGAFAPRFREAFHLTASETALLVAVPVLLGVAGANPDGHSHRPLRRARDLLDPHGGGGDAGLDGAAAGNLLRPAGRAFLLGLAGSSFAIGVGYVSRWTPAERQGSALGVYGLGNIGQSAAVFLGPVLAARVGMPSVYPRRRGLAGGLGGRLCAAGAQCSAPAAAARKGIGAMVRSATREKLSWLLAAFYFLTFGGFVAFSIYLPTLLKDEFHLTPADAGFRTAGFVVLATLLRPLGGWLSDRIGGARVLSAVFLGVAPFAMLLAWPSMIPFTVGALGCAALLGLGNGAVFKLVPQYFPGQTGDGHRTGRRHGRPRRILPAPAAGLLPQPHRRHLAGLPAAGLHRAGCSGGRITASSCRASKASISRCRPIFAAPPTVCAPAPGPRCGPRCWSPQSWWARAICRTSIPRW